MKRDHGAWLPLAAVGAVAVLLVLLAGVVNLDHAKVPKPSFRKLALAGWPDATPPAEAGPIVDAILWWLCLSFVLWVAGLVTLAWCARALRRATKHDATLRRRASWSFGAAVVVTMGVLLYLVTVRRTPLLSFALLVNNLDMISPGFVRLTVLNTALALVLGTALLLTLSLLLLPGAHADATPPQMQALTGVMYVGAAFLLVWISAATAMYRLAAMLLVAEWREPALKLAPTISLMGGLFVSLLLAAAYLAAVAWLQQRHESGGGQDSDSPKTYLAAHWPKVITILMPLLPGAAESVLQMMTQAP